MCKKIIPTTLAILLTLIIMPQAAIAGEKAKITSNLVRCTLIVVIDGLQESHLKAAQTPNINGLIENGITTEKVSGVPQNADNVFSALLTGNKNFFTNNISEFYSTQSDHGYKTIFIDGTDGQFTNWADGADVAPQNISGGAQNTIKSALKEIKPDTNTFCIIVLPRIDPKNLSATDNQVGFLLNHLRKLEILNNSFITIAGTTGSPPVVLSGPGIVKGLNLPIASFEDIGATIRYLNNQETSGSGMILYEAIKTDDKHSREYLLQQRVKDLSERYARLTSEIEQTRQEQKEVKRQRSNLDAEKAKYTNVIEEQQKEIDRLKLKITLFKLAGLLIFLLFVLVLYFEYRFLKKRFMFFT